MWTLDDIQTFVTTQSVQVPCRQCARRGKSGVATFLPALIIFPEISIEEIEKGTMRYQAKVELEVRRESKSCLCMQDIDWDQKEANEALGKMNNILAAFLQSRAPAQPVEDEAHREEVLAGRAY